MIHEVHCGSCQAVIGPGNVDLQRELATCTRCGRLTDLRGAPAAQAKPRPSETCPRLVANVRRGNTNINDVWTQDGNVSLECKELSGAVTFAGCH